jgi:hypothetical protein
VVIELCDTSLFRPQKTLIEARRILSAKLIATGSMPFASKTNFAKAIACICVSIQDAHCPVFSLSKSTDELCNPTYRKEINEALNSIPQAEALCARFEASAARASVVNQL